MSKFSKQISLGYTSEGKRVRRWIHADSEQELKRKERELFKNIDKEMQSSETFGAYAEVWFEAFKAPQSKATQNLYRYALNQLKPLNNKPLKSITRTDVQKIINTFMDRPSCAHIISMTVGQIFDSAAADNLIAPKYMKFSLPKKKKTEKRALTEAEKKAIKAADLTPQERLFVDIEYYLGLRPEETRALTPKDFDFKQKTVNICKASALHNHAILKDTKTVVTRTLPVPDVLLAEIKAYNEHFRGFFYFVDEEGELFGEYKYRIFGESIFEKINKALGGTKNLDLLNGMTMYTFRHNRATDLYYLPGVSTKKKAAYMGHSEMTFIKTYSHLDERREDVELLRAVTNL